MTETAAESAAIQMTDADAEVQAADAGMNVRMIATADVETSSVLNPVLSSVPLCLTRAQAADVMNHKIRNY